MEKIFLTALLGLESKEDDYTIQRVRTISFCGIQHLMRKNKEILQTLPIFIVL